MTATEPAPHPGGPLEAARDRSFGEEGARLTYGSYLRLPELLALQVPRSDPVVHDELLFVTVHQVYELWFAQLLHELTAARDAMLAGELARARRLLHRVHVVQRVLVEQIAVLETMTPQDFLRFRQHLAPASGFQSAQFREVEFLSGAKDPGFLDRFRGLSATERARLARRLAEPSLWDAFCQVLAAHGLPVEDGAGDGTEDGEVLLQTLLTVARDTDRYGAVWDLAEALLDHDEMSALWRSRHVAMVERQIGTKSGTGGSTGAPYLRSRLGLHYYPLLWELRSHL